jgi:catechol 2,3-dioxygenase-like lactoylglutathione lyase family enzyme
MAEPIITGVDFVSMPTRDLAASMTFYGETLGMPRSMHHDGYFAEYETGAVTISVIDTDAFKFDFHPTLNHLALHVADVGAARATLTERGVEFEGETFDTGVCHMAFFADPDGNKLMLHSRYAPRVREDA